jgi:hypothetical protein
LVSRGGAGNQLKLRETFARKKIMGRKSAKPTLHLVPPTGTIENSPPRTLGEHGSSLSCWRWPASSWIVRKR